jgi:hypothetical protein
MTTTDEYTAEALSMLSQYGQTVNVSGNGLAKCPYVYKEQYDVGDIITIAFSGKTAKVQILSVTERWAWNQYDINFSFGKPQNTLSEQLQIMLRKIQGASDKTNSIESVKWYTIPTDNLMPKEDVTCNTLGFTGAIASGGNTFTLYLDNEGTGAKTYNIYVKNLSGNYNLTLTTGRSGKTNYVLKGGVNLTGRILVDDEGNITSQSVTATSVIERGNNQPATSDGVNEAISAEEYARNMAITNAINNLDVLQAGGDGKYIESISETDGKISATEKSLGNMVPVDEVTSGNMHSVTSNTVAQNLKNYPFLQRGIWDEINQFSLDFGFGYLLFCISPYSYATNIYYVQARHRFGLESYIQNIMQGNNNPQYNLNVDENNILTVSGDPCVPVLCQLTN